MDVHDYPCPSCGYDGPHPVLADGVGIIVECGDTACALEFSIDPDDS